MKITIEFDSGEIKSFNVIEKELKNLKSACGVDPLEEIVSVIKHEIEYLINEESKYPSDSFTDPCPECGTELIDGYGGGVKCPSCSYWFCY